MFATLATWTPLAEVRQRLASVQAGREIGPRFVSGGPLIDGEPALFKEYLAVGTVVRARQVVYSLHAVGAEFIKIYNHLPRALLDAIIERARYHGLPFVDHVPLTLTTGEASDLGMRSVEHAYRHRMPCATAETEIRRLLVGELEARQRGDPVDCERLADSAFLMGSRRTTATCAWRSALASRATAPGSSPRWWKCTRASSRNRVHGRSSIHCSLSQSSSTCREVSWQIGGTKRCTSEGCRTTPRPRRVHARAV